MPRRTKLPRAVRSMGGTGISFVSFSRDAADAVSGKGACLNVCRGLEGGRLGGAEDWRGVVVGRASAAAPNTGVGGGSSAIDGDCNAGSSTLPTVGVQHCHQRAVGAWRGVDVLGLTRGSALLNAALLGRTWDGAAGPRAVADGTSAALLADCRTCAPLRASTEERLSCQAVTSDVPLPAAMLLCVDDAGVVAVDKFSSIV